jgi:putative solute:sodium symporter small subunit
LKSQATPRRKGYEAAKRLKPKTGAKTMKSSGTAAEYWKQNLKLMAICLVIWLVVSYGLGIWFAKPLNHLSIGGYPLGFWFAQQGSIYTFVALDRQYDVHED